MQDVSQIKLNLQINQTKHNKLTSSKNSLKTLSSPITCWRTSVLTSTTSSPKESSPWLPARLLLQRWTSQSSPPFLKISVWKKWKNKSKRKLSTFKLNNFPQKLFKPPKTSKSWLNSWPLRNQTELHLSSKNSKVWLIWPKITGKIPLVRLLLSKTSQVS